MTAKSQRKYTESVKEAFVQRQSSIILGLTGKTGSGCSTVASILSTASFSELGLPTPKNSDFKDTNERKYTIVYRYMSQPERWTPFKVIHASGIIFTYVLDKGYDTLSNYIEEKKSIYLSCDNLLEEIKGLEKMFQTYASQKESIGNKCHLSNGNTAPLDTIIKKVQSCCSGETPNEDEREALQALRNLILKDIPCYKGKFEKALANHSVKRTQEGSPDVKSSAYIYLMQTIGNNIRCSGDPYKSENDEKHFFTVAKRIEKVIGLLSLSAGSLNDPPITRICIDAIRNSYEAFYFKDKYSYFYLVSVNTDNTERKRRLDMLDRKEQESLDETEHAKDDKDIGSRFYHQNMSECLSISDIHLYNPRQEDAGKNVFLTQQILKYLSLMLHPGLIAPTAIERCMQTAYVAKLNSGCLSRQVGAVITDQDFSIKAIGWNDVPSCQVPCNLRCAHDYVTSCDKETYSDFERQNAGFHTNLTHYDYNTSQCDLLGLSNYYCFKDVYNSIMDTSNQVYTRALHAEENAFLQISKYGGIGIQGGKLFCTASPCELCSKKAFQLGIREIYYIDPYPGISKEHILQFGTLFRPSLNLFYGAIGNAYINLFTPRIPLKDELELLTGKSAKKLIAPPKQGIGSRKRRRKP